jgi:hypothetical protein
MKKIILTCIATCCILAGLQAQNTGVSDVLKNALSKNFPSATKIKWSKEGKNYEADFEQGGKIMSAVFSPDGVLKETETSIAQQELPKAALSYYNAHYKGKEIKETAKIVKASGELNYEIGIHGVDIVFDANGKFLREERD